MTRWKSRLRATDLTHVVFKENEKVQSGTNTGISSIGTVNSNTGYSVHGLIYRNSRLGVVQCTTSLAECGSPASQPASTEISTLYQVFAKCLGKPPLVCSTKAYEERLY